MSLLYAGEPASKAAPRCDLTKAASVLRANSARWGFVQQLDRWKPGALEAKWSPVTLRGASGRRADEMRSDMPSPVLSVTPPH